MGLQIILDVANAQPNELDALAALIASLRGEMRGETLSFEPSVHLGLPIDARGAIADIAPAPTPPAATVADSPNISGSAAAAPLPSDALIHAAAHAAAGAPATDSSGLPWDERIHASTRATNVDGSWRNKRGVDKDLLAQVEAELRAAHPTAPVPAAPTAPPAEAPSMVPAPPAAVPAPPQPPVATPAPPAAAVPAAPPPTAPVAPAPTPPAGEPVVDFMGLMRKVTGMQTAGTLTVAQTSEISATLGIGGVRDLMKPENADKIAMFDALLPPAA